MQEKQNNIKWLQISQKVKEDWITKTFEHLRKNEIEPILIKGRANAEFYPNKFERQYHDIDICVSPENFKKAEFLLKNNLTKYGVVDLHDGLRHLDTLDWENLYENSILLELNNHKIRILRPEDHLRILAVHWLMDGGEYKDRLYDIFWVVKNRPKDFDWERCLNSVSQNRRYWIICVIGLTHKYLKLNIDDLPFSHEAKQLPKWLVERVEKEWDSQIRIIPLLDTLENPKMFFQQLSKRFPPNPIAATVMEEGSFKSKTLLHYQVKNILRRAIPSIQKIWKQKIGG